MPTGKHNAALVLPSVLYVLFLLADPAPSAPGLDLALGQVVYLISAVALLRRGHTNKNERLWTYTLAAGILLFVVGADLYSVQIATGGGVVFGSLGGAAYLLVYPLFLLSVLTAARAHLRRSGWIVAVDGLSGALAATAAAGAALAPVLTKLWFGPTESAIAVFFPAGDVLLVAAALGAVGLIGLRDGRRFALWALGMVVFVLGDIVYINQLVDGVYEPGTWLDGVWAVGCALMAVAASSLRPPRADHVPGAGSLSVAAVSAATGVLVLVLAPATSQGAAPTVLAVLTLACSGVRFLLAFLQLRELAAVRELSLTDELTGFANRRALHDQIDQALIERHAHGLSTSDPRAGPALIVADLDHFKEVNDTYGHAVGDEFLRAVVRRFAGALESVGAPHLISRLGGDEFAILLHPPCTRQAAVACATALRESLSEVVVLDEVRLHAQASIGVALAPDHARSRGDLLFAADAAMYVAKTSGDAVTIYSDAIAGNRRERLTVAEDLYHALERDELTVEYQPIVAIGETGQDIVGVEALVRWEHPTRGRMAPDEFLPTAERHRLTAAIATRVLDVTLGDLERWRASGRPLRASVNVSASDLHDEGLIAAIDHALRRHRTSPADLTIEVTESAMMRDPERAHTVMTAISDLGVRLSVDDYGTGYSSLDYLLRLPIDEIKLDRAFSRDLTHPRAAAIARSTIDLTHALGLHMVAEGVENERALGILRDLGCDLVQGWHLGRPMTAQAINRYLGLDVPDTDPPGDSVGVAGGAPEVVGLS